MSFRRKLADFIMPKNEATTSESKQEAQSGSSKTTEKISLNPTVSELNSFFGISDIITPGPALYSATYYACMLIRCNAFAKLPLKIMQALPKGGARICREHPLYEMLTLRPNSYMSAYDFKWATKFMTLHYGNGYWVYTFERGRITGLYLLDSEKVQILVDDAGIIGKKNAVYYYYYDSKGQLVVYPHDKVVHFKCFPTDGIHGIGVRHFIASKIHQEQLGDSVVNTRYEGGLHDPVVVQYTGDLSNQALVNKINKRFAQIGGVKNAGKVVPIPAEFTVSQLETRMVDAQFFELRGLNVMEIANAFGVKSFQLNNMEKSTFNNVEQQNKSFYTDTLMPDFVATEQEVDWKLLFSFDRMQGIFSQFNADAILRGDIKSRYEAYNIGITGGFIKPSEVREMENRPFEEGSDKLIYGNGAAVPMSDIGIQYK